MKNIRFLIIFLIAALAGESAYSQAMSGVIQYEEKVNQHLLIPPGMDQMKNFIDQYSSTFFRLYFDPSSSLYKAFEEDQPVADPFAGGGQAGGRGGRGGAGGGFRGRGGMFGISSTDNIIYTSTSDNTITAIMSLLGETYYMEDPIQISPWKFGPEKRTILDFECSVAYYTDNSNPDKPLEITAWYTTKIKPFVGPDRYNTLPGGILALDINAGERYWVARKIDLRDLTAEEKVAKPTAGKNDVATTYEEYLAKQQEQNAQMMNRFQGGGGRRGQ